MRRVVNLYRSSVGKKVMMALTGLILFGFIVLHMLGNLKAFQGPGKFDAYGEFIRAVGGPVVPEYGVLWAIRIVLLAAVFVHIVAAVQLWRQSGAARRIRYEKLHDVSFSYASRTMRWGGVIIGLFVVYHILHFTTGHVHPDFTGSVHANLVVGFQQWPVALFYILAVGALALHLYHGLWSATQTLGANHPRYNHLRRPFAFGIAFFIFIGYVSVPVAVMTGIIP
jgi:succinate dehydrogenase / fumarate reductase, cytochrome b subunit